MSVKNGVQSIEFIEAFVWRAKARFNTNFKK